MDTVKKLFGGNSKASSAADSKANSPSLSHESLESKASTPEPAEPYTPAKKTAKRGVLEDVYPWIKLLPAPPTSVSDVIEEGYEEDEESATQDTGAEGQDEKKGISEGSVIDTRGMVPKNIDDRGRIRAACVDCDCDEFERSPKGAACHYCHCAPSSHELLWPPPAEANEPPADNEENNEAEEEEEETEHEERPNSPGPVKSLISNFKRKIKPKTTAEELEEAKQRELEEIRRRMEEEVEAFEKKKKKEFEKLKEIWSELYFKGLPAERCSEDKRGVLRGRCRDCDCDGFESDLPASSSCAYCGCAPTYHVAKVDYFNEDALVIYNNRYVNESAIKNWKRSGFLAVEEDGSTQSNSIKEEEENQQERSRTSSFVQSEEEEVDEKGEATVKEIYPWIKDKKKDKQKSAVNVTMVKRGQKNPIQEMTNEIRKLRTEIDNVMFYDNEESLQSVVQTLWENHQALVNRLEEFMSEMNAETPPATPDPTEAGE